MVHPAVYHDCYFLICLSCSAAMVVLYKTSGWGPGEGNDEMGVSTRYCVLSVKLSGKAQLVLITYLYPLRTLLYPLYLLIYVGINSLYHSPPSSTLHLYYLSTVVYQWLHTFYIASPRNNSKLTARTMALASRLHLDGSMPTGCFPSFSLALVVTVFVAEWPFSLPDACFGFKFHVRFPVMR